MPIAPTALRSRKRPSEQAFVIHKMLGYYLADPATWRDRFPDIGHDRAAPGGRKPHTRRGRMSTGQIWAGVVSFCLVVAIGSAIMWRLTRDDRRRQL
jgi:hypothetical protein